MSFPISEAFSDPNFIQDHGVLTKCLIAGDIRVPIGITEISKNAFADKKLDVDSISLPFSVTKIQERAFSGLRLCTDIKLSKNITEIGEYAFSNCTYLTEIVLPESLSVIPTGAFFNCAKLQKIKIPDSVTEIGTDAFANCTSLQYIELGRGISKIGADIFDTVSLIDLAIPDLETWCRVDLDEDFTFGPNTNLVLNGVPIKTLSIPKSITKILPNSFTGLNIESVNIPPSVTTIGEAAFAHCLKLRAIHLPGSVTEIRSLAFFDLPADCKIYYYGTKDQFNNIHAGRGTRQTLADRVEFM